MIKSHLLYQLSYRGVTSGRILLTVPTRIKRLNNPVVSQFDKGPSVARPESPVYTVPEGRGIGYDIAPTSFGDSGVPIKQIHDRLPRYSRKC